ncbi:hypothetical protein PX669_05865 [Acinetobacter soli]|nr:hypothetical protein PX669_05865 [Acinetobacter soli]
MDNFEDVLNQHKEKARKVYAESGEGNLVRSALREIESNCADYEYYFQMGQQSKQKRIDELQARIQAATAKWISIASILVITESNVPDVIYKQLDELHDALCGFEPEQALKGGEV